MWSCNFWEILVISSVQRRGEIAIEKSGSVAEAALVINNVFTDAQRAADQ